MLSKIKKASDFIKENISERPLIGLILGSGLGYIADKIENKQEFRYEDIPNFPLSTVQGHEGKLVIGTLEGVPVAALKGRFHAYEGHGMKNITFPIYFMREIGVKGVILTNAAGGVNKTYTPGDIIADTDFINFSLDNPLIGPNYDELGVRFPPMAEPVDHKWLKRTQAICKENGINIKEGTYVWVLGPCYETPAEIKMFEKFGGDLVGMSTVPEVIACNHAGLKVIAFSAVTNFASGILPEPLNHNDVIKAADKIKPVFEKVVNYAIKMF